MGNARTEDTDVGDELDVMERRMGEVRSWLIEVLAARVGDECSKGCAQS